MASRRFEKQQQRSPFTGSLSLYTSSGRVAGVHATLALPFGLTLEAVHSSFASGVGWGPAGVEGGEGL